MTIKYRKESMEQVIKDLSLTFFARESNNKSILTVTNVMITEDLKTATIYISIFPEKEEIQALHFAKRMLKELQKYLREKMRRQHIPFLKVELDKGQKILNKMIEFGI